MTFVPAPNRYDRMQYRRSGRSGLQLPEVSLGLWHNFGHDRPLRGRPRDRPARLRPRDHPLRPREQLRAALRLGGGELRANAAGRPRPVSRRAHDLDQSRLGHVARPLRRRGAPGSTCSRASTRSLGRHRPGVRRHLLLAPTRSGHAARGDDGGARHRRPPGKGAVRRDLVLLPERTRAAAAIMRGRRYAAPDPPAVLLDAEPLDRAPVAGGARGRRDSAASPSRRSPRGC